MATLTPKISLNKPTPNVETDWAFRLNETIDTLDDAMLTANVSGVGSITVTDDGSGNVTISGTDEVGEGGSSFIPNALVGSDGITVTSGDPTDDIAGFRGEFVNASGTLQTSIDAIDASVTLQEAYDNGDGTISTTGGKPLELTGDGELTAVTGTFTSGITIGDGTTFIFPDEIRVGQLTASGDVNTSTDYNIGGTQVLSLTTLGSSVVNSSLTNVGTLTGLIVDGFLTMDDSRILRFNQGAKIQFTGGAGNNFIEGNVNNSGRIGIFTDNTERITILLGGNVGIGNTPPASKLTVAGSGTFSGDITATSGTFTLRPDVSGDSVATQSQIDSVQTQIDAVEGSDVDDINSLVGSITVVGKGEVGVTVEGQNIVVSGTPHEIDTDTISDALVGADGITVLSGTPTASETTISGFRDEFLSASGTLVKKTGDTMTGDLLITNNAQITIPLGSASAPSIIFEGDPDTGIASLTSDAILFVTGGDSPVVFTSSNLFLLPQIVSNPGSASAPQFSFLSSADTGMYGPSVGELAFATGGIAAGRFDGSQNFHANADVIASGIVSVGDGTEDDPTFTFISDPNTGLFSKGTSILGITANDAERLTVSGVNDSTDGVGVAGNLTVGGDIATSGTYFTRSNTSTLGEVHIAPSDDPDKGISFRETPGGTKVIDFVVDGTRILGIDGNSGGRVRGVLYATLGAGSAATPVYQTNETDTGMYSPGTNQLGFSAGGTETLTISGVGDSTDGVGIVGNLTVTGTVGADVGTFETGLTVSGIPVSLSDVEGITDIVQDLTPQLGGDLDVNGKSIVSVGSTDIIIQPGLTGGIGLFTGKTTFNVADTSIWIVTSGGGDIALDTFSSNEGAIFLQAGTDGLLLETFDNGKIDILGSSFTDIISQNRLILESVNQSVDIKGGLGINFTGELAADNGSTATPSYAFKIDDDTGMYRPAPNVLGFAGFGNEILTVTGTLSGIAEQRGIGVDGAVTVTGTVAADRGTFDTGLTVSGVTVATGTVVDEGQIVYLAQMFG